MTVPVPSNKKLFDGTVPSNKKLYDGTPKKGRKGEGMWEGSGGKGREWTGWSGRGAAFCKILVPGRPHQGGSHGPVVF